MASWKSASQRDRENWGDEVSTAWEVHGCVNSFKDHFPKPAEVEDHRFPNPTGETNNSPSKELRMDIG